MVTVRSIDDLGRIVIPSEIRKQLGITAGAECRISLEKDTICIEPCVKLCFVCSEKATIAIAPGKHICKACAAKIKNKV